MNERFGIRVGNPVEDRTNWVGPQNFQNCVQQCERHIVELYRQCNVDEAQLLRWAHQQGIAGGNGGVSPDRVGEIMKAYGISYHHVDEANIHHLMNELASGHKVIVAVRAQHIWRDEGFGSDLAHSLGLHSRNHAILLSEINTDDPEHIRVRLFDPGGGRERVISWDLFEKAAEDAVFDITATDQSAPEFWQTHGIMQHNAPPQPAMPAPQPYYPTAAPAAAAVINPYWGDGHYPHHYNTRFTGGEESDPTEKSLNTANEIEAADNGTDMASAEDNGFLADGDLPPA